jgi:hypothetical protein
MTTPSERLRYGPILVDVAIGTTLPGLFRIFVAADAVHHCEPDQRPTTSSRDTLASDTLPSDQRTVTSAPSSLIVRIAPT